MVYQFDKHRCWGKDDDRLIQKEIDNLYPEIENEIIEFENLKSKQ
jgi:hypothetical protein